MPTISVFVYAYVMQQLRQDGFTQFTLLRLGQVLLSKEINQLTKENIPVLLLLDVFPFTDNPSSSFKACLLSHSESGAGFQLQLQLSFSRDLSFIWTVQIKETHKPSYHAQVESTKRGQPPPSPGENSSSFDLPDIFHVSQHASLRHQNECWRLPPSTRFRSRAVVHVVSSRLPTVATRERSQVRLCGICDGQVSFVNSHSISYSAVTNHPSIRCYRASILRASLNKQLHCVLQVLRVFSVFTMFKQPRWWVFPRYIFVVQKT